MANSGPWVDFENVRYNIKFNTVDKLKHIVNGLNEECHVSLSKSGRKQELIDRITDQLLQWKVGANIEQWNKAKIVINQVRTSGMYSSVNVPRASYPAPTAAQSSHALGGNVQPYGHASVTAGSSSIGRYDPYAPPRRPVPTTSTTASSGTPVIRFKPSPFVRIERAVSGVVECPESSSATDRRQQTVTFTLTADHIAKLSSSTPKYQLRLYCTSSTFYSTALNAFRTHTGPCPIEFPPTCEIRVNNVQISANTKGLKKKPGTAPPADLGKAVRMTASSQNRVELIYVNSQQPVQAKKFYMIVNLVEVTALEQLVDRLKKGKYKSRNEILAKMISSVSEDDDIVAGPQKMSLKCPLSYIRISTPCRSVHCVHSQCFDATSWFSMMEQTTTYMCPVCERVLNYEDLIVDGYFDSILKESSESVEDVIVEADGEWHTSDNKFGSTSWKLAHPPTALLQAPPSPRKRAVSPLKVSSQSNGINTTNRNESRKLDVEILVLDSDDDDDDDEEEGRVKRELSPSGSSTINRSMEGASLPASTQSQSAQPQSQSQTDVIDLTLDSDDSDDEPVPPLPRAAEKRKVSDNSNSSPTDQTWKKARVDSFVPPTLSRNVNENINGISGGGSSHTNGIHNTSSLNPLQMIQFDPVREIQRSQSSAFQNRLPIPRPSSILRPPDTVPLPPPPNIRNHYLYGSNSPPQPPSHLPSRPHPHPNPNQYQQASSGNALSRGRDFSSFGSGQGSRWYD